VSAQTTQTQDQQNLSQHTIVKKAVEEEQVINNTHQVITNFWHDNWFVFGDAGINAYWGDYTVGNLSTRLTPQVNIGLGKWFVPGFGAKIQFTGFRSKENKSVETFYTGTNKTYYDGNNNPYWKEKIKWWDFSVNMMFNLSRLIKGYEGIGSPKLLNQFIASVGIGATHHLDYKGNGSSNHWSGHLELQYSRFFSPKKNFSLDASLRGIFYSTEFDLISEQFFDENISLNFGFTYYFKDRGWKRTVANTTYHVEDRTTINQLNEEINRLRNELAKPVEPVKVDTVVVNQIKSDILTYPYFVNFVIDKVEVVNRERVNLKVVAEMMKATPNQKYMICGYADKYTGTVARNIWLAEHRSKNVFKILTEEFGVPASQLVLDDKGGVDNMFYDDPQLSRSVIISKYNE
jgi:outer membrane protein OmpA-like peptidoglycan-associated protein